MQTLDEIHLWLHQRIRLFSEILTSLCNDPEQMLRSNISPQSMANSKHRLSVGHQTASSPGSESTYSTTIYEVAKVTAAFGVPTAACKHHLSQCWHQSCSWRHQRRKRHKPGSQVSNKTLSSTKATYSFEFISVTESLCRYHIEPFISICFWMHIEHIGCNEARTDSIDTAEINPLDSKTFG